MLDTIPYYVSWWPIVSMLIDFDSKLPKKNQIGNLKFKVYFLKSQEYPKTHKSNKYVQHLKECTSFQDIVISSHCLKDNCSKVLLRMTK